jgi:hypothetical protein
MLVHRAWPEIGSDGHGRDDRGGHVRVVQRSRGQRSANTGRPRPSADYASSCPTTCHHQGLRTGRRIDEALALPAAQVEQRSERRAAREGRPPDRASGLWEGQRPRCPTHLQVARCALGLMALLERPPPMAIDEDPPPGPLSPGDTLLTGTPRSPHLKARRASGAVGVRPAGPVGRGRDRWSRRKRPVLCQIGGSPALGRPGHPRSGGALRFPCRLRVSCEIGRSRVPSGSRREVLAFDGGAWG